MLKFCLTFDCEGFISFKQGNPRWNFKEKIFGKINNLLKTFRYNRQGFNLVYHTIGEEIFPCTFMLVGKLFKPLNQKSFIEWGHHTLNHVPLTLSKDEIVKKEIKNIYHSKSFCAPLWMVRDINSPDRILKMLKKEGYKNIVYKGEDDGIKHFHKLSVSQPENRLGLKLVHLSNCFEGNSSKQHILNIKKDIMANVDKDAVYLLSSHDFTHRNNKNLLDIIKFARKLEAEKKIKIVKLGEL